MVLRLQLHETLLELTENAYFQPPPNYQMSYPAIVYQRSGSHTDYADNRLYRGTKQYQVTVIDRNPDSELPDQVERLPLCSFDRFFAVDNLNHWVFTLFF
jgi:hypothetical protein